MNNSNKNSNGNRNNFKNEKNKAIKTDINARNNKAKYSDDEISRAKYVESKAKFIVRDRISNENIDTRNKWIDISNLDYEEKWDEKGNFIPEILSFDTEIFDRTVNPKYTEKMTEEEKHQLTYDVAESDIEKQKQNEKRNAKRIKRPSFHVDVSTKRTKDRRTEYEVNSIKRKK